MTAARSKIYVFKRFERFWHWSQGFLILFMAFTGFEIHGTYRVLGFERAAAGHTTAAWVLIGLWVFAIFWHLTTGEWRQYIPTTKNMVAVARYYSVGIFTAEPHPFRPTQLEKHNPLQRVAYLMFKLLLAPAIWASGLLYLYYGSWADWGLGGLDLAVVAAIHTIAAFALLAFTIGHVYMVTTGETIFAHTKAMITGWEEVEHKTTIAVPDTLLKNLHGKVDTPGVQRASLPLESRGRDGMAE